MTTRPRPSEGENMLIRTRLTMTGAVLLVGTVTTACGGSSGAPGDASRDDFCSAQSSLFADLDLDLSDPEAALPTEKDMADALHSWADRLEEVGTPDDIPEEARAGYEETVKAARDVSVEDLESPDLDALGDDMSQDAQEKVETFATYVSDTCGSAFGDLDLPEMPELSDPTQ